jgi:hypothetical protein
MQGVCQGQMWIYFDHRNATLLVFRLWVDQTVTTPGADGAA